MARDRSPVAEGGGPVEAAISHKRRNSNSSQANGKTTDSSRSPSASPPSPSHRSLSLPAATTDGKISAKKKVSVTKPGIKEEVESGSGHPVTSPLIAGLPCYTWEEVAKHNTPASCWCYIGTKVYDITSWLDRHPGGRQVLLLSAGRDCTDLFISYHPFTEKPAQLLAKYCIGQVTTTEFPQYQPDSGFYKEVRQKVAEYFKENKLDSKDAKPGLTRLAIMMLVALTSYGLLISSVANQSCWVWQVLLAMLYGWAQALPLLHLMHDASHCAIGHSERGWAIIGRFTLDFFVGASMNSWHNQHILGHHVYTNVLGVDPDLPQGKTGSFRRVCSLQRWHWAYRLQHLYLLVLYGFTALKFRVNDITDLFIFKTVGPIRMNDIDNKEVLSQVCSKVFWILWRFVLPIACFGAAAGRFLLLQLVIEFITGYYLNFSFQISHVSPLCDFPDGEKPAVDDEWAYSQLKSTLDYAYHSKLTTFMNGALNYQSVHHLFPSVSQYHYPALAPIINSVGRKYGIKINYVNTFTEAFNLHLQHLYTLGVDSVFHHH
ncbi:hypothetical protein RvY_12414 [Ramazzottius varieornatus]|uniref:Cytochrome b5 heme-binding domain-containing protein n=1 Tax=Ramazzottius varieornatus TaxID=947166 RepID=A0A1D1VJF2_RAMVA|nr:hypothetical protein RvY_12414 [Ramazzottius varieornatus]